MDFSKIYYFQTDVMCIIPLLSVLLHSYKNNKKASMDDIFLRRIIYTTVIYSISDFLYYHLFYSDINKTIIIPIMYIINIVYVGIPLIYSIIITKYTVYKLKGKNLTDTIIGKIVITPLIVLSILTILTPFTHFVFTIDSNAEYHRALGAYFLPVVAWAYLLTVSILTTLRIRKTDSIIEKESLTPLANFLLFPFLSTVIQLLYYGLSLTAFGFTVAIVSFYMSRLRSQISNDELTGLKSRSEFKRYVNGIIKKSQNQHFFVIMLDYDKFKKINDNYGHIEGDKALQAAGLILKNSCLEINQSFILSRYGGDEFIIVGKYTNQSELDALRSTIYTKIDQENESKKNVFTISLSYGLSHKSISSYQEFCTIISDADEEMYKDKKQREKLL